jgi:hypothetical protein
VQVASILELLNAPPAATRSTAKSQTADPSRLTFIDSLLAASHASSDNVSTSNGDEESGQQPNFPAEDLSQPGAASLAKGALSSAPNYLTGSQQVLIAQPTLQLTPAQTPLTDAASIQLTLPVAKLAASLTSPKVAAVQPKRDNTQPTVERLTKDHPTLDALQAALLLPSPAIPIVTTPSVVSSQTADNNSYSVENANASTASSTTAGFSSQATKNAPWTSVASFAADLISNGIASVVPGEVQNAVRSVVQSFSPSPTASVVPGTLPSVVQVAPQTSLPVIDQSTDQSSAARTVSSSIPVSAPKVAPTVVADAPNNLPSQATQPGVASTPQHPDPVPVTQVVKNTSSKTDVTPTSTSSAADQANPPATVPDPIGFATGLSVPNATANQMTALVQPAAGVLTTVHTNLESNAVAKSSAVAGAKRNDVAVNTSSDVQVPKQHAPAASGGPGSQDATSSDDQPQSGAVQPGQGVAPAQMSFTNHTLASTDHAAGTNIAPPPQPAAPPAGIAHPAKTQDTAAPVPTAPPQALPTINTARLIQNVGQSEMRVGMRSNEFGNISINTSATRDSISAQISVDHGELAKTLAAHLPEMQARLGGSGTADVRIDMNGHATGQGTGTSTAMSENQAGQSRGDRQQSGTAGSGGSADQGRAISTPAMPLAESNSDARLDIRA